MSIKIPIPNTGLESNVGESNTYGTMSGSGPARATPSPEARMLDELHSEYERLCTGLGINTQDIERLRQADQATKSANEDAALSTVDLSGFIDKLTEPELRNRLQQQANNNLAYLDTLISGQLGRPLVEQRFAIDHAQIAGATTPSAYIGLLHSYLSTRLPHMLAGTGCQSPHTLALVQSLFKVILLDLGLVLRSASDQAYSDPLTDLPNRRALDERLTMELGRARRFDESFGLMVFDIDHFKQINDRYGHPVGDRILLLVSETMRSQLREVDLLSRTGGDEFTAILPHVGPLETELIGERIRRAVAGAFIQHQDLDLGVTLSIGAAVFPNDATDATSLRARSDKALYLAKKYGRNRVSLYREVLSRALEHDHKRLARLLNEGPGWVRPIISALDYRAPGLYAHSRYVAQTTVDIARTMGLPKEEVQRLELAAWLHDIGVIAVSDDLANGAADESPTRLDSNTEHPVIGGQILKNIPGMADIADIVLHHHECWDGRGVPDGLAGNAIPIGSRIIHLIDHVYSLAFPKQSSGRESERSAIAQIRHHYPSKHDPRVISALEQVLHTRGAEEPLLWRDVFLPPTTGSISLPPM